MFESKAKLQNVRMSAKKVRLVADAIRGLEVGQALDRLPLIFKNASPVIEKLLKSAVANAMDRYDVKMEDLKIKSITVDKAMDLKRWKPAAFGRAHPFKKHSCHMIIILEGKKGIDATLKTKKTAEIETVDITKTDQKVHGKSDKKVSNLDKQKKSAKELMIGVAKNKSNVKKG